MVSSATPVTMVPEAVQSAGAAALMKVLLALKAETLPLGEVPSLPPAHDAVATASWIQSVLSGERPVPPSIASQVDCVLAALKPAAVPAA